MLKNGDVAAISRCRLRAETRKEQGLRFAAYAAD
jgi:hypothetical protein